MKFQISDFRLQINFRLMDWWIGNTNLKSPESEINLQS